MRFRMNGKDPSGNSPHGARTRLDSTDISWTQTTLCVMTRPLLAGEAWMI